MADRTQVKVKGMDHVPMDAPPAEHWKVPAGWIDEMVFYSVRGTWLLTNQGPVMMDAAATLIGDLGTAVLFRDDDGQEILMPKNCIARMMKPGRVIGAGGLTTKLAQK